MCQEVHKGQQMKGPVNPKLSDTMIWYVVMLLNELLDRQDKRMDELETIY